MQKGRRWWAPASKCSARTTHAGCAGAEWMPTCRRPRESGRAAPDRDAREPATGYPSTRRGAADGGAALLPGRERARRVPEHLAATVPVLGAYPWSENVRELENVVEREARTKKLGITRRR